MPDEIFRVAVLTPSTGICRMAYAQSLARLIIYFAQNRVYEDCSDQQFFPDAIEGSGIGANYERLVKKYLDHEIKWTHFFFVEDDMGFEPDILHILARRRLPIVGCNYRMNKGDNPQFTALSLDEKSRIATDKGSTGIEEAYYIGFGATLIERKVFEQLEKPWFLIGYNTKTETYSTQDSMFCKRAREECGFKNYVDHDASKKIWHVGPRNYRWNGVSNG